MGADVNRMEGNGEGGLTEGNEANEVVLCLVNGFFIKVVRRFKQRVF